MRFATFVAFMLPLAALAAPTPTPSRSDSFDKFNQAYYETDTALKATIDQLNNGDLTLNGHRQATLSDSQLADTYLESAHQMAVRIYDNTSTDLSTEYVNSLCAYTVGKNESTRRFCSLQPILGLYSHPYCPVYHHEPQCQRE